MLKGDLKVTLVQQDIVWEDKNQNLKHLDNLLENILSTDLVILPELFTTGFTMNVENLSETMNGKTVSWMKDKSKDIGCYFLGSAIIRDGKSFYNRLLVSSPNGEMFYYDKRHLFAMGEENKYYTKGTKKLIFKLKEWRICPLVCYDLRFPVWSRNTDNYDVLIYVANWPAIRQNVWKNLLVSRAIENQGYSIGVNRVGVDGKGVEYEGGSCVIDAKGNNLYSSPIKVESVHTVSLDFESLANFRDKFPVLMDMDSFSIRKG